MNHTGNSHATKNTSILSARPSMCPLGSFSCSSWKRKRGGVVHLPDLTRSYEILRGLTRSHKVLRRDLTRSSEILRGLTGSYEVSRDLTRSHEILRGLTGSYEVSRDLTRSHGILRGPARTHEVCSGSKEREIIFGAHIFCFKSLLILN